MVDRDRGRYWLPAFRIHPPYRLCEQYSQEHIRTAVIFAAQLHDRRFGQSQIEVSLFPIIILQFLFHPVEIQNRLFGVKRLCGFRSSSGNGSPASSAESVWPGSLNPSGPERGMGIRPGITVREKRENASKKRKLLKRFRDLGCLTVPDIKKR